MPLVLHLSDLHLFAHPDEQSAIFDALCSCLRGVTVARERPPVLVAVTGDVFDSASVDPDVATRRYVELHERMMSALGGEVPTVIVPGNHDRRSKGLVGPHREELFQALERALKPKPNVWVHGTTTPFLSAVIPASFHGQKFSLVAYDSTYLPRGLLSAGGVLRQEDLLSAAARVEEDPDDWPALLLVHHHLVPTPLTDLGTIEPGESSPIVRWTVERMLPELIANADREELTMTALGAGTALSTLHTLGRAVVVLHGHKHYATVRLLRGITRRQGDVLLASAGSAGTAERWSPADGDAARLWPSFNLVEVGAGRLAIDAFSFAYKGSSAGKVVRRALVRASQRGPCWDTEPVDDDPPAIVGPRLSRNESVCRVYPSRTHGGARWDYECLRTVERHDGGRPGRYFETIAGAAGSTVFDVDPSGHRSGQRPVPAHLDLVLDGVTRYAHEGGICRTVGETERVYGIRSAPYEWLGLMNRYASDRARLLVHGLPTRPETAFASVTDLGTGIEEPLPLRRDAAGLVVERSPCPPRTLLRVYWPVESGG